MQREDAWFKGKPIEAFHLQRVSAYQDAFGKIRLSRETAQQALEIAKKADFAQMPATLTGIQAVRDALHGFTESARQKATALLKLPGGTVLRASAAVAFAEIGDAPQSQKFIDQLAKENPGDTTVQTCVIPNAKALNLLHQKKPADAITALEAGRKFELGENEGFCTYAILYTRGLAYLELHDGAKAAAEFQKILDRRGLNPYSCYYPLAQLQIARAYALQGDHVKARTAYQDFFALWKDADPDVPILIAAKSEYAKLP
jgi:tetratricopeptide (TPR) repeat protein